MKVRTEDRRQTHERRMFPDVVRDIMSWRSCNSFLEYVPLPRQKTARSLYAYSVYRMKDVGEQEDAIVCELR